MLTLTTSATLVALIQTAAGLPVVLFAVPAGAIGDLVDRRRLLLVSQSFMLLAAALLAGLALAGLVTPVVLLVLIFAVGAGQTLTSPTWQTLQPELVAPEDRTQAIGSGCCEPEPRPSDRPSDRRRGASCCSPTRCGRCCHSSCAARLHVGGVAWILVLSTLNSQYQSTLPGWAKARGMAYYLVVFQGAGAAGSAAFGAIAQEIRG